MVLSYAVEMGVRPTHESSRGQERLLTPALSSTEEEREKLARGGRFIVAMRAKNSGSSHLSPPPQ